MKTLSSKNITLELSFKNITIMLVFAFLFVTSVFAVLKGTEHESLMSKIIFVAIDMIWVGGIICVTTYCLFLKKNPELDPSADLVSMQAQAEGVQEAEYTYIDLCSR